MERVTEQARAIPQPFKNAARFLRETRVAEQKFSAGEIRLNQFLDRVEGAIDRWFKKLGF